MPITSAQKKMKKQKQKQKSKQKINKAEWKK